MSTPIAVPLSTPSLPSMSTYPLDKLLGKWKNGDITVEQVAGHLLQHVIAQEKRIQQLEQASKRPAPPAQDSTSAKQ